jgi:hypothetical protein
MDDKQTDQYSPAETKRRMKNSLCHAFNRPPQPHKDMVGNGKRVSKG